MKREGELQLTSGDSTATALCSDCRNSSPSAVEAAVEGASSAPSGCTPALWMAEQPYVVPVACCVLYRGVGGGNCSFSLIRKSRCCTNTMQRSSEHFTCPHASRMNPNINAPLVVVTVTGKESFTRFVVASTGDANQIATNDVRSPPERVSVSSLAPDKLVRREGRPTRLQRIFWFAVRAVPIR